ncbi:hypothetical protein R6Q57_001414 [Mikania cordata]
MRRRDDEKVEQFMERFITESMQIQGVPERATDKGRPSFAPYSPIGHTLRNSPLTKSPSEILATEKAKNSIQKPPPLRNASRPNPDKYCEFHRCHGHKTNNCMHLRKEIEAEVKSGKFSYLVKEIGATFSEGKELVWEEEEIRRSYVDMIRRVAHIHVDGGSGSEIMYKHCFRRLDSNVKVCGKKTSDDGILRGDNTIDGED